MQLFSIPDGPKMLKETLCVAQGLVGRAPGERKEEHVNRLQRLIDECDKLRPVGADGKHGSLHTPWCGCDYPCTCGVSSFESWVHHKTQCPYYLLRGRT